MLVTLTRAQTVEVEVPAGWHGDSRLPVMSAEEGLSVSTEDLWQASLGDGTWILDVGWDDAKRRYDCRVVADGQWEAPVERAYLRSADDVVGWARDWFDEVEQWEGSPARVAVAALAGLPPKTVIDVGFPAETIEDSK